MCKWLSQGESDKEKLAMRKRIIDLEMGREILKKRRLSSAGQGKAVEFIDEGARNLVGQIRQLYRFQIVNILGIIIADYYL